MTSPIQWYPGHIAKLERELSTLLKSVDVVVEVLDVRIPLASQNLRLQKKIRGDGATRKPVLRLLNKSDLGDPDRNRQWLRYFRSEDEKKRAQAEGSSSVETLLYHCTGSSERKRALDSVAELAEIRMQALVAKGFRRRPVRVLVVGMPNVGKSSVINSLIGRKKAQTGHKAGVTRDARWIRIHPMVDLMDTPGVIPPRLDSQEAGLLLALVSSVGEAAYQEEEAAEFLLTRLADCYPGLLAQHYGLAENVDISLDAIALQRLHLGPGGRPDRLRTARTTLSDFRQGRLGRLTLEVPSGG